jgi:Transport and Golgi organisation 2
MCTFILLRRPDDAWPVLIAANRDELATRPWSPPARYWPDRPVVAGRDEVGGGTWLALNEHGVVAGVLNRENTLGPMQGKRSRGELPLEALDHADAAAAAEALGALDPTAYRPFNLVIADNRDAFVLCHRDPTGEFPIDVRPLPAGLSFITAAEPDDPRSSRIAFHKPRFAAAPAPDPESGDWTSWEQLLASRERAPGATAAGAMFIEGPGGFGTVCASLLALPAPAEPPRMPVWRFAAGKPEAWRWTEIGTAFP